MYTEHVFPVGFRHVLPHIYDVYTGIARGFSEHVLDISTRSDPTQTKSLCLYVEAAL